MNDLERVIALLEDEFSLLMFTVKFFWEWREWFAVSVWHKGSLFVQAALRSDQPQARLVQAEIGGPCMPAPFPMPASRPPGIPPGT